MFKSYIVEMTRLTNISFILLLFLITPARVLAVVFDQSVFELKGKLYQLEIADTVHRKSTGLMYRQHLQQNQGMLFVYQRPGPYKIWMKNTIIPLTVLWLDGQARVIDKKLLTPCAKDPCPSYGPPRLSHYIIELKDSEYERFDVNDQLPSIVHFANQ